MTLQEAVDPFTGFTAYFIVIAMLAVITRNALALWRYRRGLDLRRRNAFRFAAIAVALWGALLYSFQLVGELPAGLPAYLARPLVFGLAIALLMGSD